MTYRSCIAALCAALTLVLAGCLEYEETITIESNSGSGSILVRATIPASFAVNVETLGPYAGLIESESAARSYLEARNMELVSWSSTSREDSVALNAEIHFEDLSKCSESRDLDTFKWVSAGDGKQTLTRAVAIGKPIFRLSRSDEKAVERLDLRIIMNVPSKVELAAFRSGSYTSVDGSTARWEISGKDFLENFARSATLSLFASCRRPLVREKGLVFNILVGALIVLMIVGGYSCRLFGSLGTFFAVLIANTVALNLFEPIAGLVGRNISGLDPFADALCYILVFFGVYIAIQMAILARFREWLSFHTNFDRFLSLGVGFLNGIMLAGVISTLYFLLPLTNDWIGGHLNPEDPAPHSVRIFRQCANRFGASNRFDPIGRFPHKYSD